MSQPQSRREDRLANALHAVLGTCSGRRAWLEKWPKVYAEATAALKEHEEAKAHVEPRAHGPCHHETEEHEASADLADRLTAQLGPRTCPKGHRITEGIVEGVGHVAVCECDLEEEMPYVEGST